MVAGRVFTLTPGSSPGQALRELTKGQVFVPFTLTPALSLRESQTTGSFSLRITGEKPIPLLGHQADFTSQYRIRTMVPTRTALPTPSPTPNYPDPGAVIPEATPAAVEAWSYIPAGPFGLLGEHIRRYWTNTHGDHNTAVAEGIQIYLPSVIMHEFGHTAGLDDLYKYDGYSGYLMDDTHGFTAIPTPDRDYLRQAYRNETWFRTT